MNIEKYKYSCIQCDFFCQYESLWKKHIETELHKTGKRKKRNDCKDAFKCIDCEYETKNSIAYKKHILNTHSDKETREKEFKFYCKYCDFGTFAIKTINEHNETSRHKLRVKRNQ